MNSDGVIQTNRQSIADVFADFYAQLYACRDTSTTPSTSGLNEFEVVAAVTDEELQSILKTMANRKSADTRGVVVELLKHSNRSLLQVIANMFNDLLAPDALIPSYWQHNVLKILFKKGDPASVDNYRPIAVLPILYKLFSKMVCARVKNTLIHAQSVDQAGFRPGFSCDDHLFVVTLISEMFVEFRRPLWAIAIDFRKAFDSVIQSSLWSALMSQSVPRIYVHLLQKLYDGQSGEVRTDCSSKHFRIERGVRQGDPISPILFNATLEDMMRKLVSKWSNQRGHGIQVQGRKLTNLRFADDLLLFATSFKAARAMLGDLMETAEKYGLEVHESKTKLLWNGEGEQTTTNQTTVCNRQFDVLDKRGSTMYLGRLFSFESTHDVELHNRINRSWAKFAMYRSELTDKCYNIERRLKLFKAVVQPTLLYGCACWTMTRPRERLVRTTQRRMLRQILGTRRNMVDGQLEEWVDWIIRATEVAEQAMRAFDVPDWVDEVQKRRFRWAGHVARRNDGRWTREVLTWSIEGSRSRGRPLTRWTDSLRDFFASIRATSDEESHDNAFWMIIAEDRSTWQALENQYVDFVKTLKS